MLEPRTRWIFPSPVVVDEASVAAGAAAGLSRRVVEVLARRGIADHDALRAFLAPPDRALHDPRLLPDADRLLERLEAARTAGERVMVFGDFDADGLSGLATMTIALRALGLSVDPYVPSRLDEGHGLSMRAVEVATEAGVAVIVTVDCGSTSGPEIAAAVARGIDVLVTDHHRVPAVLPPATAIVNPHRPDSRYPDDRLSGSGVAFKIAELVLADVPNGPELARSLAELAIIGTVSDVAPILGENRAIAQLGLRRLRAAPRPGIRALLLRAGVEPASVDLETIAFVIAPRINAAGRVGEAIDAATLLLTDDDEQATELAARLEAANGSRRELTRSAFEEASALIRETTADGSAARPVGGPAIVVRGPWPVGIVGLVAARLAEAHGRPAIVGATMGDLVRASCRGSGELDLGAALDACDDLFVRHGGHAGAAGFEIAASRWEEFQVRFLELAEAIAGPPERPSLRLDLALPASELDYPLLRELRALEPTGTGNPEPLVAALGATVGRIRSASGGHTQLTLRRERDVVDGIAFGRDDLTALLHEGDRVDVVVRLTSRVFAGFESLQFDIRDVAPCGSHPEAAAILAGTGTGTGTVVGPRIGAQATP
ncbi:MAG: single-stranded-DNA-specific exonuclease RecJ [Chloroflexi bacterium]|nr:single-stranded-DNA-specific exonuclease RecJ [Chloroflexota bacterium]